MCIRDYLFLALVFVVSAVGFGAYEAHQRGLLMPWIEQLQHPEQVVETAKEVAEPTIIAQAPQKVNMPPVLDRVRRNQEILALAEHNEKVIAEAEAALQERVLHQPTTIKYVVQKGDSLWKIAGKLLGDNAQWSQVYEQNKAEIGVNPDLIQPGQVLTITGVDAGVAALQ